MANQSRTALLSFNSGEWTPKLEGRVDLPKYKASCRTLENAIADKYGYVARRPGMRYIGNASADIGAQQTKFVGTNGDEFILVFYLDKLTFLKDGTVYKYPDAAASTWSTSTSYTKYQSAWHVPTGKTYRCLVAHTSGTFATDLSNGKWEESSVVTIFTDLTIGTNVQATFQQINDVVEIATRNRPVKKLTYTGYTYASAFTIADKDFLIPPLRDENLTSVTLSPTATTGTTTLTASSATFNSSHIGSYWQIGHSRPSAFVEISLGANGTSSTLDILGTWDFETHGTWTADVAIERSFDGSNWERVKVFSGKSDVNHVTDGSQTIKQASYRLKVENYSAGSGRALLTRPDSYVYGLAKVTAYTSSTLVSITVISDFYSTAASVIWREGAWSAYRGYPDALCLYEGRMFYAGSGTQAMTIWGSAVDGFNDFEYGTSDSDAFSFTLSSNKQYPIQWMVGHNKLVIGTSGDEWVVSGGQGEEAITPTNIRAVKHTAYGSEKIQAVIFADSIYFVESGGSRIREFIYSFERDGYIANNLMRYADHVLDVPEKITSFCVTNSPYSAFWATTSNGHFLSCVYDRAEDVISWSRHNTVGDVYTVTSSFNSTYRNDDLYFICSREYPTDITHEVIRFDGDLNRTEVWYSDSSRNLDLLGSSGAYYATGVANYLRETPVSVLVDGSPLDGVQFDSAGYMAFTNVNEPTVIAGIPYTSVLKPQRIDVDGMIGPTQGMTRRIREIVVRFNKTVGLTYGDGKEKDVNGNIVWRDLPFRDRNDPMDEAIPFFSGEKRLMWSGDFEYEGDIILKQEQPLPWNIMAIIVKYEVTGR